MLFTICNYLVCYDVIFFKCTCFLPDFLPFIFHKFTVVSKISASTFKIESKSSAFPDSIVTIWPYLKA
jgi:hypothetical protein